MDNKEQYLEALNMELAEFGFEGNIIEEPLDTGVCFHVTDSGWCIERSHRILKKVIGNLEVYCTGKGIDDSKFYILID